MRNDFLSHSYKGTSWKNHLYDKKVNGRYFYSKNIADEVLGDPTDMIEGFVIETGKIGPIQKVRDVLNTPVWSPNKEDETLVKRGKEKIAKILKKDTALVAKKRK